MKVAISCLLIILFIFSSGLSAANINFFLDFNFITFSSFSTFINSDYKDKIKIYLEYNSLIPIYLSWNNYNSIKIIQDKIKENQISVFKINQKIIDNELKNKWYNEIQQEFTKIIFSSLITNNQIYTLDKIDNFIHILNFKELNNILKTISKNKLDYNLNFKIDLSLFLYNNFSQLIDILFTYPKHNYNFFIYSAKNFPITKKEIESFLDLIYNIKTQKYLTPAEKNIFNLTCLLFSTKLFNQIDDVMLNLFPLTSNLIKKYNLSSMEYSINNNHYVTLFDKKNFFTFNVDDGCLKKWFIYNKGINLINFDSFIEKMYLKDNEQVTPLQKKDIHYFKFSNGLSFQFDYNEDVSLEKNIILQSEILTLSYKIKNLYKTKKNFILEIEDKLSPSLYSCLTDLNNNFAFYNSYKKKITNYYSIDYNSFINLNSGYGIKWNCFNAENGVEFYRGFYYFIKKSYYKFSLYPYEQKVITIQFYPDHVMDNFKSQYLNTNFFISNQYYGDYSLK